MLVSQNARVPDVINGFSLISRQALARKVVAEWIGAAVVIGSDSRSFFLQININSANFNIGAITNGIDNRKAVEMAGDVFAPMFSSRLFASSN